MGFPDRIERTIELDHPPPRVWEALTTAEGLGSWFGDDATIELRPGGDGRLTWRNGHSADLRVERVEPSSVFGFTWPVFGTPEDDPRRSYVEFTLEPTRQGSRLTVVETGFAQLAAEPYHVGYDAHVEGWARELNELVGYLAAA